MVLISTVPATKLTLSHCQVIIIIIKSHKKKQETQLSLMGIEKAYNHQAGTTDELSGTQEQNRGWWG